MTDLNLIARKLEEATQPVSLTVLWDMQANPDLRLIRGIEALIDHSVTTHIGTMTDEEVDLALEYLVRRRALIAKEGR